MIRDEIGRKVHTGTWGDTLKAEMELRGYVKWSDGTWHHRTMPNKWMSNNAASQAIATRMDNWSDGFDAGLEWCLLQLKAYQSKTDAVKRIKEELQLG